MRTSSAIELASKSSNRLDELDKVRVGPTTQVGIVVHIRLFDLICLSGPEVVILA